MRVRRLGKAPRRIDYLLGAMLLAIAIPISFIDDRVVRWGFIMLAVAGWVIALRLAGSHRRTKGNGLSGDA